MRTLTNEFDSHGSSFGTSAQAARSIGHHQDQARAGFNDRTAILVLGIAGRRFKDCSHWN